MKYGFIAIIFIFTGTFFTQAQAESNCIAPVGSPIGIGAEISISDETYYSVPSTLERSSTGFFEADEGVNGVIVEGPECIDGQQYWRVFYDFYFIWVDARQLAPPYLVSPSFEYGGYLLGMPETLTEILQTQSGVAFAQPTTIQVQTIATIPNPASLRRNSFRVHSNQQFRVIAFDFSPEFFGIGNRWVTPGIYIFPNNGNLSSHVQMQFDVALENPALIGDTLFLEPIPTSNAATPILADGTRIDFSAGGQGFRYLTYLAHSVMEVPNQLNYIYQGFTSDGYLVAGVFPVQVDFSGTDYEALMQTVPPIMQDQNAYEEMITTAWDTLRTLPHDAFTPNLDDLDNMMRSVEVGEIPNTLIYAFESCDPSPMFWENDPNRTAPIATSYLRPGITAQRVGDNASILREFAGTEAQEVGRVPAGASVEVLSGPQCNGDYAWFEVQYGDLIGWVAEGYDDTRWFVPQLNDQ